ncbi:MAG TPA: PIG-L family deacetylase [Bacteroidia bacterium]|nr:PIG-L family deacetylase [Bacteroidia bacterium]
MKRFFLLGIYFISQLVQSQNSPQMNSAEILQSLKKLNTVGSVLYIAAHPDDENTRLLGYLAKERNLRTGYLSLTRGDGGQNLIGKEQGEPLGLIRTQELLAARRIDGAEQFFTRANDFGFSKNPKETFSIWNKDSILADVVLAIRKFKPDVVICRFPTTGEGGHGHHTASAILALEAFDAAADPTKFLEQLAYTQVWQAKSIFWNTFNFGTTNTTAPDQLKIDVGVFNPLLGKSYGEIAADSRSMHKSQGFGSAKVRGESIEYFKQLKGDKANADLFEGINQTWVRFTATASIQKTIDDCIKKYNPQLPEKIITDLIAIYKQIKQLDESDVNIKYWKQLKLKETETLLLTCSGLWVEAYAADYKAVPDNDVFITAQIITRNNCEVKLNSISFFNQTDTTITKILKQNELLTFKHKEKLAPTTPFSNPYWLNEKHPIGMYTVNNKQLIGKPENDAFAKATFDVSIYDLNLKIDRGLVYKYTDPVKGEVYRPFEILPSATINISDKVFVFSSDNPKDVTFTVKANTANVNGTVQLKVPEGWIIQIKNPNFKLIANGDEAIIEATITPKKNSTDGKLQALLNINEVLYTKSIKRIEYDHIPYQFILSDAEAGLVHIDLKKTGNLIGYIPGAGDDVPACLKQIGYDVTLLTDELLAKENLSKYNCIITGVRAYNTNERLQIYYTKLMDYVKNGGNLVVQYNTNSRIGPVGTKVGPYPFTISRDRVTDDNAEVRFINSKHSVLNYPNIITQKDFDGWVQERGIYFASDIDKNYETIFSINDPDEKASEGSLIVGKYGKGNFVYTGLVFFRELPAGVPGAYRLFANLLSLPINK